MAEGAEEGAAGEGTTGPAVGFVLFIAVFSVSGTGDNKGCVLSAD